MVQIWKSLRSFCTRPNRNQNVPESTEENKHCVQYIHILEELCWLSTFAVTIFPNFCISCILFPNKGDENEEKLREWKRKWTYLFIHWILFLDIFGYICSYTEFYFWIYLDIFVLTMGFISGPEIPDIFWYICSYTGFNSGYILIYFNIFVHRESGYICLYTGFYFWIYLFIAKVNIFAHRLGFISARRQ